MRASVVLTEVGQGLRRNIGLTVAVVLTVLVAGILGGIVADAARAGRHMKDYWYDKVEVSIYLCSAQTPVAPAARRPTSRADQRKQIEADLTSHALVADVYYESKEEAYAHFKEQFRNNPDIVEQRPGRRAAGVVPGQAQEPQAVHARSPASSRADPASSRSQDSRAIFDKIFSILNVVPAGQPASSRSSW